MISTLVCVLRFVFRSVFLFLFIILLLVPILMLANYYQGVNTAKGRQRADSTRMKLARWMLLFFGIRVKSRGMPSETPVLFAANHISTLDVLVLYSAQPMGFVAKAEIEHWPLFSFMARTGGSIFHHRGSHDSAASVTATMVERLQQGYCVAIFPEGGILPGKSIRVFHARMFRAAVDSKCPVQPLMVRYMRNGDIDEDFLFREGENMMTNIVRLLARPGVEADVHFLPVIDSKDRPRRALADAARAAVIVSYNDKLADD